MGGATWLTEEEASIRRPVPLNEKLQIFGVSYTWSDVKMIFFFSLSQKRQTQMIVPNMSNAEWT